MRRRPAPCGAVPRLARWQSPPRRPSAIERLRDQAALDDLFARCTMERERDVHRDFLRGFGIVTKAPSKAAAEDDDGAPLF
jgi:hypothetical protein